MTQPEKSTGATAYGQPNGHDVFPGFSSAWWCEKRYSRFELYVLMPILYPLVLHVVLPVLYHVRLALGL